MIDRAYMFGALHENPKTVLEIGLSSASWAKVLAEHRDVDVLDIVEINPKYYDVIRHYPEQLSIYDDPKVFIFYDDGRRWLKRNPNKKYDFILMNTSFHWRDQINNLVSKEFLEICKAHLYEGGVLYYNSTSSLDIPYTAGHVFEYVTRYRNFVAASDSPFPADFESKKNGLLEFGYHGKPLADQMDDELTEAVNTMANTDISDKRSKFLAMKDQLNLITDDNLASEFKTRKKFFAPSKNWLQLLGKWLENPDE
jgi:spermidine synthase